MNTVRLTRRGRAVVALAIVTIALLTNLALRDVCWAGNGYGSCQELWNTSKEITK
jgi:hypothetical protein